MEIVILRRRRRSSFRDNGGAFTPGVTTAVSRYDRQPGAGMAFKLTINRKQETVDVPGDTPLLWVIRDVVNLKGTKYGCGIGMCGACTVHQNGVPIRSCLTPVSAVTG